MKKLFQFSIIFLTFILSIQTNAQIYYQDISPDVTLNTWSMKDLNIDTSSTAGLPYGGAGNLTIWEEFDSQIAVNAFSDCQVLMNGSYPAALSLNQPISSTDTWMQPNYSILNNGTQGNWMGVIDKYLGVRIKKGSQWLYGWIRLDVNTAGTSVTIKDYACNRAPGSSINAGQIVTGINNFSDDSENSINIYPNPFNSFVTIKSDKNFQNANIVIYNSFGQKIKELTNLYGQEIKLFKDNLTCGIYFIRIMTDGFTETKKLILEE
jgi:hypothetical protein